MLYQIYEIHHHIAKIHHQVAKSASALSSGMRPRGSESAFVGLSLLGVHNPHGRVSTVVSEVQGSRRLVDALLYVNPHQQDGQANEPQQRAYEEAEAKVAATGGREGKEYKRREPSEDQRAELCGVDPLGIGR